MTKFEAQRQTIMLERLIERKKIPERSNKNKTRVGFTKGNNTIFNSKP